MPRIEISLANQELELFEVLFKKLKTDFKNIYLEAMINMILNNQDKIKDMFLLPKSKKTLQMLIDKAYKLNKNIKEKDRIVKI